MLKWRSEKILFFGDFWGGPAAEAGSLEDAFYAESDGVLITPGNPCGGAANLKGFALCRRPLYVCGLAFWFVRVIVLTPEFVSHTTAHLGVQMSFFVDFLSVWGPSWNPLGMHFANFSLFEPPVLL